MFSKHTRGVSTLLEILEQREWTVDAFNAELVSTLLEILDWWWSLYVPLRRLSVSTLLEILALGLRSMLRHGFRGDVSTLLEILALNSAALLHKLYVELCFNPS